MLQYLLTKQQLEAVSLARLGKMVPGQYSVCKELSKLVGVDNPRLIIETVLKQPSAYGITEVVYPIAEFEWDEFSTDPLASYTPIVHVVDGDLYTAGI